MREFEINTVKTHHQETQLFKSGSQFLMKIQKKIKQAAQFLNKFLKKLSTLHFEFCWSNKFIGGDDFETKSMTLKIKEF